MEKSSKLKNVQGNGTFNDLFKFEVEFEDGTNGIIYRKSNEAKVEIGENYNYTINEKGTVKIIPPGKPYTGSNNYNDNYAKVPTSTSGLSRDELIVRQTCIKAAVDFCKNASCSPEEVTANAQIFRDWIFTEKADIKAEPKNTMIEVGVKDDLPF